MVIHITSAVGTGSTKLAAFHAALIVAGAAQYNLIRLSSIIPPGSVLKLHKSSVPVLNAKWGDRLYLVYAEQRTHTLHEEAWAGIGWVHNKKTGAGLLVEHEGTSKKQVEDDIQNTLNDLMKHHGLNKQNCTLGKTVAGLQCQQEAVCALAIAVFQSGSW